MQVRACERARTFALAGWPALADERIPLMLPLTSVTVWQATLCPYFGPYAYNFNKVGQADMAILDFERNKHDTDWVLP